ncbi:Lrp/AsnC family transcriptional regulator [Massilia sp. W12]|uniref:Lrp/AsnC family transcriptional regulator n=1 Tax=Massilia sp. W12 TaxID=3126507 RepID=UPI0030D4D502
MDKIDRQIIEILHKDARISLRELGEAVHLSANTVGERIKRLQQQGVISGYHAALDLQALGLPLQAMIDVKLARHTLAQEFEAAILTIPGILEASLVTGSYDYLLRVACVDQGGLMRIIETLRTRAGAQDTYSRVILRHTQLRNPLQ